MERRIGVVAILVRRRDQVPTLNHILSQYNQIILGRLGLPLKEQGVNVISLIVQGSTDEIGAMTGKIGRLTGIQVKSVLTPNREESDTAQTVENKV
jgi:putative iron-only hydrogenase system regulator